MLNKTPIYSFNFKKMLEKTDIFIIEICGRKTYSYNNIYVHSILSQYSNDDISKQIKINRQDDKEITNDIMEIISQLNTKKIIFIGHIVTNNTGERYELSCLLEKICFINNILFINPVFEITKKGYNINDLVINESKILHYNEMGHKIMKDVYEDFIKKLILH
jgi:hypothetical protein